MSDAGDILIACPKCGVEFPVPEFAIGANWKCLRCGHVLTVERPAPRPAAASPPPAEASAKPVAPQSPPKAVQPPDKEEDPNAVYLSEMDVVEDEEELVPAREGGEPTVAASADELIEILAPEGPAEQAAATGSDAEQEIEIVEDDAVDASQELELVGEPSGRQELALPDDFDTSARGGDAPAYGPVATEFDPSGVGGAAGGGARGLPPTAIHITPLRGESEAGTPAPHSRAGTPAPPVQAGTPTSRVQAGTPTAPVQAGTPTAPVQAGTPAPRVQAGTPALHWLVCIRGGEALRDEEAVPVIRAATGGERRAVCRLLREGMGVIARAPRGQAEALVAALQSRGFAAFCADGARIPPMSEVRRARHAKIVWAGLEVGATRDGRSRVIAWEAIEAAGAATWAVEEAGRKRERTGLRWRTRREGAGELRLVLMVRPETGRTLQRFAVDVRGAVCERSAGGPHAQAPEGACTRRLAGLRGRLTGEPHAQALGRACAWHPSGDAERFVGAVIERAVHAFIPAATRALAGGERRAAPVLKSPAQVDWFCRWMACCARTERVSGL